MAYNCSKCGNPIVETKTPDGRTVFSCPHCDNPKSPEPRITLVKCPDCGRDMAVSVDRCVHCGSQSWQNQKKTEDLLKDTTRKVITCPDCGEQFLVLNYNWRRIDPRITSCPRCGSLKGDQKESAKQGCRAMFQGFFIGIPLAIVILLLLCLLFYGLLQKSVALAFFVIGVILVVGGNLAKFIVGK